MAKISIPDHASAEIPRTDVDNATLAKVLRCDERTVRKYVQMGIVKRTGKNQFALFQSIGGVVEHYRQLAAGHGTADAMKANAALKDAQRRLVDLRFTQLDNQLISMPEIEIIWGDLIETTKWLFLSLPARARFAVPHLTSADEAALEQLCQTMLEEAVVVGDPPLPTPPKADNGDAGNPPESAPN